MYKQFGGEVQSNEESSSPSTVTVKELNLGQTIQLLRNLSAKVSAATDRYIEEFSEQYGQPNPGNMQLFQSGMLQMSEGSVDCSRLISPFSF